MINVKLYETGKVNEACLKFVVICVKHNNQWLLGRHRERDTWEMAGGHIEAGETARTAAIRELYEETGIISEHVEEICDYDVWRNEEHSFGRLFYLNAENLGELPNFEIAEVRLFNEFPVNRTYPDIYKVLLEVIRNFEENRENKLCNNMKTNVYFVRHAQPDFSVHDDMLRPLTEKGIQDTRLVTKVLLDKSITKVYSSPCKRAYDTLKDLAESKGLNIGIIEDFRERKVDNEWVEDFKAYSRKQWEDFEYKFENGECLREVQERNISALNEIVKSNLGRNIAVGSHGTALSTIINYYNPQFGYDNFCTIADKMPYVICFKYEGVEFIGMEEVEM